MKINREILEEVYLAGANACFDRVELKSVYGNEISIAFDDDELKADMDKYLNELLHKLEQF